MVEANVMEKAVIHGRRIDHYMVATNIGDIHIVQHEAKGFEVTDDYMGWSNAEAEKVFEAIAIKILKGRA